MKEVSQRKAEFSSSANVFLPALRRFFQRRVPSDEVEDLVQDVFVSLQARKTDAPIENSEAYLFTIARNVLSRHWQRNVLRTVDDAAGETEYVRDTAPLQDQQMLDRESLGKALQAIGNMPERTRNIFLMHRFEDMTYAAIARHVGVSTSAVEKHIMTALQILVQATGRNR